jgi:hypothetical protein
MEQEMGPAVNEHEKCSPAMNSSGCSVLSDLSRSPSMIKLVGLMTIDLKVVAVFVLLTIAVAIVLFTDNSANPHVRANFSGPPAGFTGAPGELRCDDCHTTPTQSNGSINLNVPPTYTPGQTYNITVAHTTTDQSKVRWGFEMTALDGSDQKAGAFASLNSFTQVINNQGPIPSRQYIEQTTDGSFFGQHNGASWTFQWTAPSSDVGVITFYVAGNQANGDGNSSGDNIYFTFAAAQPVSPPQLRLEQNGPSANQAAALDALLLARDPFHVHSIADWFNLGSDQNTRVMVFAANLPAGSVTVNLVDANSQSFDVAAEDVRAVASSDLSQITFRLPDSLAAGTCTVTVKVGSLVSNAGTIRIVP